MVYFVVLKQGASMANEKGLKMKTKKAKTTRHGKHDADKVNFGGMVTPEFKALAQLTASKEGCGLTELMMVGIRQLATKHGIMKNGRIVPVYEDAIKAMADVIRSNLASKREEAI